MTNKYNRGNLHYIHVQKTEKPTPEAESHCSGSLRLVCDSGIIQSHLAECISKTLILVGIDGKHTE